MATSSLIDWLQSSASWISAVFLVFWKHLLSRSKHHFRWDFCRLMQADTRSQNFNIFAFVVYREKTCFAVCSNKYFRFLIFKALPIPWSTTHETSEVQLAEKIFSTIIERSIASAKKLSTKKIDRRFSDWILKANRREFLQWFNQQA